jgi:hypothetical protein
MPGPCPDPGRGPSVPDPQSLCRLLQSHPNPSCAREGRPSWSSRAGDWVTRSSPTPRRTPSRICPDGLNGRHRQGTRDKPCAKPPPVHRCPFHRFLPFIVVRVVYNGPCRLHKTVVFSRRDAHFKVGNSLQKDGLDIRLLKGPARAEKVAKIF